MWKNSCIYLLLCFSLKAVTFQDDFASHNSITDTGELTKDKIIASKPFGYCLLDGLPREFCRSVSIDLYGKTFKDYSLTPNTPERVDREAIDQIVNNFHLGIDDAYYDVPTAGQLVSMIKNGIISDESGCHWITFGPAPDDHVVAGYKTTTCSNTGALTRIVTSQLPSACKNEYDECGLNYTIPKTITFRFATGVWFADFKCGFRISYTHPTTGQLVKTFKEFYPNQTGTQVLPKGATNVSLIYTIDNNNASTDNNFNNIEKMYGECFVAETHWFDAPSNPAGGYWKHTLDPCE